MKSHTHRGRGGFRRDGSAGASSFGKLGARRHPCERGRRERAPLPARAQPRGVRSRGVQQSYEHLELDQAFGPSDARARRGTNHQHRLDLGKAWRRSTCNGEQVVLCCGESGGIGAHSRARQRARAARHGERRMPWTYETPRTRQITEGDHREEILTSIPMKRFGRPDDVAAAVLFLASPVAGWITAECMDVNGGQYID